jgi:hypothetical protein
MMPVTESVHVPFFDKLINEQNIFVADEGLEKSAEQMLSALTKWAVALKPMRNKPAL